MDYYMIICCGLQGSMHMSYIKRTRLSTYKWEMLYEAIGPREMATVNKKQFEAFRGKNTQRCFVPLVA